MGIPIAFSRYVLVANFGTEAAELGSVAKIYSMGQLLVDTSHSHEIDTEIHIADATLQPGHAFVIKLPK